MMMQKLNTAIERVSHVIRSENGIVQLSFASLLAGGHLLFEDLPGTGKTTLAIAMSRVLGCDFNRVQFTNDMMPSDVLGTEIFMKTGQDFKFNPGPVFTHILLADEVNRATPRAQSALLEAMGEGRVSVGGKTLDLPRPFFVIATQNPMDLYGTYPLPESQLDRFFMRLQLGYPSSRDEAQIIIDDGHYTQARELPEILNPQDIIELQAKVDRVQVAEQIVSYILDLAQSSREEDGFRYGLSTRGCIVLKKASQAWAFIQGRDYVIPDDIKAVFPYVAYHRLHPRGEQPKEERVAYLKHFLDRITVPL
jgi:MoxR-like ATPase